MYAPVLWYVCNLGFRELVSYKFFTLPDTFELKNGETISFMEYYKRKYNIIIRERNQPLLVSIPKDKDRRRGDNRPVKLIPELCLMTGESPN